MATLVGLVDDPHPAVSICGFTIADDWDLLTCLLTVFGAAVAFGIGLDEIWHYIHRRH